MEQSYLNDEDDALVVVVVHYPKNRREEVGDLSRGNPTTAQSATAQSAVSADPQ